MSAWIGPLGSLVQIARYKGSLGVDSGSRSTFRRTLGGNMFEQRGPRARRTWSVDCPASPVEASQFEALVDGFYGPPPWAWVDPSSQLTNLFSPEQALLDAGTYSTGTGITQGGAGTTADGIRFGRSLNVSGGAEVSLHRRASQTERLPVLPGVPVTASVYASGSASIRIDWTSSTGVFISNTTGATTTGSYTRRTHTATPPADAAGAQVVVVGATGLTLPAFTWTTSVQPWAKGRGATKVTVDGVSESVQVVSSSSDGNLSSFSFTVRELG